MEQTTILTLPLDAITVRRGLIEVLRYIATTPPQTEDQTTDYCIGVNIILDEINELMA